MRFVQDDPETPFTDESTNFVEAFMAKEGFIWCGSLPRVATPRNALQNGQDRRLETHCSQDQPGWVPL